MLLVARREESPDIGETGGTEQRVGERVCDHVAVGVPGEAPWMVDRDTAEDERDAVRERVGVDTQPDA